MERVSTGAYTKSSTSESISGSSDLGTEDHSGLTLSSTITLEMVILHLSKHNSLIFFNSKGEKRPCTVHFADSLNILHIVTEKKHPKKVFTQEIMEISAGACVRMKRESENIYPITIKGRTKSFVLGSHSINERDYWFSCALILLKHAKECFSSVGLHKYCDSVIQNKEGEEEIIRLRDSQYTDWLKIRALGHEIQHHEKDSVKALISDMINTIESTSQQQTIKSLEQKMLNLIGDRFILKQTQGKLQKAIQLKDQQIESLSLSFTRIRKNFQVLSSQQCSGSPWKLIAEFLNFSDLIILKNVSKQLRNIVCSFLRVKHNWKRLSRCTLFPRKVSWRIYINNFYETEIAAMGQEVLPGVIREIEQDVIRGLPDHFEEVEEILIGICAFYPNVGYCQGMQQVAHFLLNSFRDSNEVLGTLLNLLRPPFFLGDLWKTGFMRLKLAIFQLKHLIKLKLPFIAKHLKKIDLRLDVIVTPWLLTVFTCLLAKKAPIGVVRGIWDLFFVNGWPALISACLALFNIYQEHVLGLDLENTLMVFACGLDFSALFKDIQRFHVSQGHLDELEKAFCLRKDAFA